MARNTKSATLPPNLRHNTQPPPPEDNENFFTKLRRKFKFKKAKYHVDLNTGECDNVNTVSFKKRNSTELLDEDDPLKHGIGRSSERSSRSESPKSHKATTRSHSDRFVSGKLSTKPSHERKTSNPTYSDPRYPQMTSGEFFKTGKPKTDIKHSKSETVYKGNEYSVMKFDKDDPAVTRPLNYGTDRDLTSDENAVQDDSAIDLGHFDNLDSHNALKTETVPYYGIEPGYEQLPISQTKVQNSSAINVTSGNYSTQHSATTHKSQSSFEFDPNYESVNDVKMKMRNSEFSGEEMKTSRTFSENTSKSMDSLDDPRYQSIRDVKKKMAETVPDSRKPFKTYDASKSIESLDEPGYESLNDVKKRISMSLMQNNGPIDQNEPSDKVLKDSSDKGNGVTNLNDSAVSFSIVNENETVGSKASGSECSCEDERGIVSSINTTQTSLTESSISKDSGFENRLDKSMDNVESLYSTVKKRIVDEETDKQGPTAKSTDNTVSMSKQINTTEKPPVSSEGTKTHLSAKPMDGDLSIVSANQKAEDKSLVPAQPMDEAQSLIPANQRAELDYDSDTELVLDPGYAECADAIKGIPPYHAFSDGSESKISSCASLDLSVEDFPPEPGYAECADAIKSGAIKKISMSHEKLITEDVVLPEDVRLRREQNSEIYANPQILFKKRSKLIERTSGELSPSGTCSDLDLIGSVESLDSNSAFTMGCDEGGPDVRKEADSTPEPPPSPEAPPLPARNYSLYLESDEAAEFVPEDCDKLSGSDDAFESEMVVTETALAVTEEIINLSNSINKEDTIRTYSECFEVHTDSQLCEGSETCEDGHCEESKGNGLSNQINDIKPDTPDQTTDCPDLHGQCKGGVSDCAAESNKISERPECTDHEVDQDAGHDVTPDECVHITVSDKQGNTKVLTVIDKQASHRDKQNGQSPQYRHGSDKDLLDLEHNKVRNCDDQKESESTVKISKEENERMMKIEVTKEKKNDDETENAIKGEAGVNEIEKMNTGKHCHEAYQKDTIDDKDLFSSAANNDSLSSSVANTASSLTSDDSITHHNHIKPNSDKTVLSSHSSLNNAEPINMEYNKSCSKSKIGNELSAIVDHKDPSVRMNSVINETHIKVDGVIQPGAGSGKSLPDGRSSMVEDTPSSVSKLESATNSTRNKAQSQCIPVRRGNSLEVVHPVKMYSISWDSDEEFQGTEHLPKLEIVESDSENVFDASDNSSKLVNDIAGEGKSMCTVGSMNLESDNMEMFSSECLVSHQDEPVSNKDVDTCVHDLSVQLDSVVHFDDVDSGHIPGNVEDVVIKRDLQSSANTNNAEQAGFVDVCDTVQNETMKFNDSQGTNIVSDSIRDSPNDSSNGEGEIFKMCNSTGQQLNNSQTVNYIDDSFKLDSEVALVQHTEMNDFMNDFGPALYDDSEPTHMSLTEIMTLSNTSDSARLVTDHLSKNSACTTDNVFRSEPVIPSGKPGETPPPRPPSYTSGQSKDRNSSGSQSGQSNTSSPMEDTLPGFRFAERSLSDVDESPPAIPPRARVQKSTHQKRDSETQDFMESMRQLKDCGWYWGPLSWEEAEQKLSNKPEGTFLVRDSSDERYILSLSFKNQGRVHHTRIEHHRGHFSFWSQPDSHGKSTIKEFIEQCVNNSENGRFLYFIRPSGPGSPPMPIHLLFPVSRFVQMQSLQHMCRFRILQMVRRDHIDDLPVPKRIKQYLKEAQYYVECLDD